MTDQFLKEMLRGNAEVIDHAIELERVLSPEQMTWRLPQGGWSVGQVFEHMLVSGRLYTDRFDALIDRAITQGKQNPRAWKPSLMGGTIMRAVNPRSVRRHKTMSVFEPGPEPRENVVNEFIDMHRLLERQIRRADGLDLRAVRLSSPASKMIRMNLGDAIGIIVLHGQRHLLQVGRIIEAAGGTASGGGRDAD